MMNIFKYLIYLNYCIITSPRQVFIYLKKSKYFKRFSQKGNKQVIVCSRNCIFFFFQIQLISVKYKIMLNYICSFFQQKSSNNLSKIQCHEPHKSRLRKNLPSSLAPCQHNFISLSLKQCSQHNRACYFGDFVNVLAHFMQYA